MTLTEALQKVVGYDYTPTILDCSDPSLTPEQIQEKILSSKETKRFILQSTFQPGVRITALDNSYIDLLLDFQAT